VTLETMSPEEKDQLLAVFLQFLLRIYDNANLAIPTMFSPDEEAERLSVELRTQGFNTQFPVTKEVRR
jgi:hypothetical protein